MPYKPDIARLSTIHSPPNSCTRHTWCLISLASWGSCAGCMHRSPSCLVCPLVCSLHCPVALYRLRVMSYCQLSCFPTGLFSPLSSCLVQVACDVILPAVLFPHWSVLSIIQLPCTRCMLYHPASWFVPLYSVQHCAPINVKLSQSTTFVVASC